MGILLETGAKFAFFVLLFVLQMAAFLTWVERKQSAVMQDRIGANRASIFGIRALGLFHPFADVLKLFAKESFIPQGAKKFIFLLAPAISMFFALVSFTAIPFGDVLEVGGRLVPLQIANLNIGVLYVFAVISMAVYGVVLGAWASNNNYALLGGLRASAQMLSYEVSIGISLIGVVLVFQSIDLMEITRAQGNLLWGWLPSWGLIVQPIGFLIFLTAGIAETKRIPFDAPEGESEIVGYFIEYSGMGFGMYFMTDFLESILMACLTVTFFLGGWQIPYLFADGFHFPWGGVIELSNWLVAFLQVISYFVKVAFILFVMMTIRWTLPRFRYDQIMKLGWKVLLPLSLANIIITAVILAFIGN